MDEDFSASVGTGQGIGYGGSRSTYVDSSR